MAKEKIKNETCSARLNKVGGQAVLEGVMMKAGSRTVTTCRKENGELVVTDAQFVSVRKKNKLLNIPILRGFVNFIEMMALSVRTLNISAEALDIEDEESKAEKWLKKHLGIGITDVIMVIGTVLGLALSLFLFMFLPGAVSDLVGWIFRKAWDITVNGTVKAIIEGVAKILIFLSYLFLVSFIPDIKRTFMYHGAEHKSIACFESGTELTPENAKNYKRFHPRCGTSYMFFMILIGIGVGMLLNNLLDGWNRWAITGIRILLLPIVMGLGYEIIMLAGKHDNFITRALSAPGLWIQRITTKEPTEDMLEVAIVSIKCALRDEFDEFREFYENEGWKPAAEDAPTENRECEDAKEEGEELSPTPDSNLEGEVIPESAEGKTDENDA